MITNIKSLEAYCKDYTQIEHYEEALKSPLKYDLHHRREISENKSRKQLIAENLYYNIPATDLIFLKSKEHRRLHNTGKHSHWLGKHLSAAARKKMSNAKKGKTKSLETRQKMSEAKKNMSEETRQKISESKKGNQCALGHHCSAETRAKLSEAKKGRHWHLENGHRVLTD